MTKNYLVKTSIQKYIQDQGQKVSGGVYDKLQAKLLTILDEAIIRSRDNDRATVLVRDI